MSEKEKARRLFVLRELRNALQFARETNAKDIEIILQNLFDIFNSFFDLT